jgi:hypothetical protein
MNYQRYFRPEQQLLLQVTNDINQDNRTELMSVTVIACEGSTLSVASHYGEDAVDHYPFRKGLPLEITTEALGMGIRTTGTYTRQISGNSFAITLDSDMQMFQRRISRRHNCRLGIRFSRAAKSLQTMRNIWERNLEVLHSPEAPLIYEGFQSSQLNISSGGLRLTIKPPANQGELCLVLVNLEDGKPPVCAIAEVVWVCMQDEATATAGMRFISILSDDQQRIEAFIDQQKMPEK